MGPEELGYNTTRPGGQHKRKGVVWEEAEEGAPKVAAKTATSVKHARALLRAPTWLSTITVKSG